MSNLYTIKIRAAFQSPLVTRDFHDRESAERYFEFFVKYLPPSTDIQLVEWPNGAGTVIKEREGG